MRCPLCKVQIPDCSIFCPNCTRPLYEGATSSATNFRTVRADRRKRLNVEFKSPETDRDVDVGFLYGENDDFLVVYSANCPGDLFSWACGTNFVVVPKNRVKGVTELKPIG